MSRFILTAEYTVTRIVTQNRNHLWEIPLKPDDVQFSLFFRAEKGVDVVIARNGERLFRFFLNKGSTFGPVVLYKEDFDGIEVLGYVRSNVVAPVEINQQNWGYESIVDAVGEIKEGS